VKKKMKKNYSVNHGNPLGILYLDFKYEGMNKFKYEGMNKFKYEGINKEERIFSDLDPYGEEDWKN
jgi:hypothetical protein